MTVAMAGGERGWRQEGCEMTNPLRMLQEYGQSVWLDFVSRELLKSGQLTQLIAEDGLRGVTSNPSIFEKAIGHGDGLRRADRRGRDGGRSRRPATLYEGSPSPTSRKAADVLRPVYDATEGRDGFVSIEVSPYLALDTAATIAEARRLWHQVAPRQSDDQGAGDRAGTAGDPPAAGRGHQRQHHAALLAERL